MIKEDENLIAYCGLCCEDCFGYNGRIPDLARDLRKELRAGKFEKFAKFMATQSFGKAYQNYDKCYEVLGAMVRFRCRKGCRDGGGNPFCKIRKCCQRKELDGCWECEEFEGCQKLEFLCAVHDDAHVRNLKRIKTKGKKEFLKGKRDW